MRKLEFFKNREDGECYEKIDEGEKFAFFAPVVKEKKDGLVTDFSNIGAWCKDDVEAHFECISVKIED